MTADLVAGVGQSLGGLGVLALVAWYVFRDNRKDTTSLDAQSDATAITLLREQREERREMRTEMNDLRERLAVMEARERDHSGVLQIHAAWDHKVISLLNKLDPTLDLEDAPPLYPPTFGGMTP